MGLEKAKSWALVVTTLSGIMACGTEKISRLDAGSLRKIDVRDATLKVPPGADGGGGGSGGLDNAQKASSIAAFRDSVYPLSLKWCAGGCHDTVQAPVFASDDAAAAHDAILTTQKVDFKAIERSRLVLRVSEDNHNCPAEGCEVATEEFVKAIRFWSDHIVPVEGEGVNGIKSQALTLADAQGKKIDLGLPPGTFLFEAESGTLKAPMVALPVTDASGGMVVHTPAGAGSQTNLNTATNQATLGSVTFKMDVTLAGNYRVIGKVNGQANANSSFYLRLDQQPLLLWDFPATAAAYNFDVADAVQATGTPHNLSLTAGSHTLEVRQREEQAKLDSIIVTNDPELDPMMVKATPKDMLNLVFDISEQSGISGAKITVDVVDYSKNGYLFKNLAVVVPSGKIKVKGVKLLLNGVYLPQHATFNAVDATVAAPGGSLSSASLVAIKDKGPEVDQFSFSFEVLESAP